MDEKLLSTLANLERLNSNQGQQDIDELEIDQNITHETGEFLSVLLKAVKAKNVLEIGSVSGYSTIWLADAVRKTGGRLLTVGSDKCNILLKSQNLREAGVMDLVEIYSGKQEDFLKEQDNTPYDFIFLDSNRSLYQDWWIELQQLLAPGGLIVVDNVKTHMEELAGFISLVKVTPGFEISIVPLGNGELLIWKEL